MLQNLGYGQVNLILVWVIVESLLAKRPIIQGLGIGLALGFKLTPGIFLVYLAATKQWLACGIACATGVLTGVLGWIVLPSSSWKYWTTAMWDADRVGGLAYSSNQSINGALWRLIGPGGSPMAWVVLSLGVVMIAGWIAFRRSPSWEALIAVALAGLLISPVSWSHHWVWVPLIVGVLCWTPASRASKLCGWTLAGGWVLCAATWTIWWLPHAENREYAVPLAGKLLTDAYGLLALASLLWLAYGVWRGTTLETETST